MAEAIEGTVCTAKKGTGLVGIERTQEVRGLVLCCGELDRRLRLDFIPIISALMGKALKGDLPSIKLLFELADKYGRAEAISEEEFETLGKMLMREFHALPEEENGSEEVKSGQ